MTTTTWTVGRGGLLGQHVERALAAFGEPYLPATAIRVDGPGADDQLRAAGDELARRAAGGPWRIAWCAGAGVVGTAESSLVDELARFDRVLDHLAGLVADGRLAADGALFVASSAGGVYAGSTDPPFDERTEPRPIAPYGHAKLAQELAAERWSARTGVPVVIGRIGNLYGPGQDLRKAQGLISQLCWTQIRQQPLTIYVPLATMRDYVYVVDSAAVVAGTLASPPPGVTVKVIASQRPMSIGLVLGEFRRVLRRNPRISVRASPLGRHQVVDLRLRSVVARQLDPAINTPFAVGLHATYRDLLSRFAAPP